LALSLFSKQSIAYRQEVLLASLALAISLIAGSLAYHDKLKSLNWLLYDHAQSFNQLPSADDIVIVEIDDKSIDSLGHWPWLRSTHATLVKKLSKAQAKLIVFDVLFADADALNPNADQAFSEAIEHSGNVILPLYFERSGSQGIVVESPPIQIFYENAKAIGHIHIEKENDGVARAVYLQQGINSPFWPHLSLAAHKVLSHTEPLSIQGKRAPTDDANSAMISIAKDYHNLIPMPSAEQAIRYISYSDVINDTVDHSVLKNKLIFVGATATGLGDILTTPIGSMSGVELNAWILKAIQHKQLIQTSSPLQSGLFTFGTVLTLLLLLGRLSPRWFIALTAFSICSIMTISSSLLIFFSFWLAPASAGLGVALFFPLWSWLRAESMLRYLRHEINSLNHKDAVTEVSAGSSHQAIDFLAKLKLINPLNLTPTEAGKQAVQVLAPNADFSQSSLSFWSDYLTDMGKRRIPDHQFKSKGVELVTRTISQLSQARDLERRSQQLIEQSLSGLQDAVCIANIGGSITYTNKRFKDWFQLADSPTPHCLLTLLDGFRLKSEKSWTQALKQLYLEGTTYTDECDRRQTNELPNNGRYLPNRQLLCQLSLVSTQSNNKDTLILAFTDISSLKAAEKARSEALSFLSHDLRSPMVSVLAILTRAENKPSGLSAHDLHNIDALVRKNLDYAESFLQLSKAETLPEDNLHPCDLHAVLDAAHAHALALAAPKNISVNTERCLDDAWILGEHSLLERAANNLISNAIKFSPKHSSLTLSLLKKGQTFVLSVTDQGIGVAQDHQKDLFKPFIRNAQSHQEHGAGLGLCFVATVMSRLNGEIDLQSEPGAGATFSLRLPELSEEKLRDYFRE